MVPLRRLYGRAKTRLLADLQEDPYLPWILAAAALLSGFWFWHRLPNAATRDEWSRAIDPLMAVRSVVADPGFEGLQDGVAWGRVPFGATFYLFGFALVPVLSVAVLSGNVEAVLGPFPPEGEFGYFPLWNETPAWFWNGYLGLVRLFSVAFAVGSVYLTYRIGTAIADRATGRLAALLLTLTFGFLTIAHEGGEDMPALFFLLLALYLLIRYVQGGECRLFLAASAIGGVAIAFKLTAAPVIGVIGVAHLLRTRGQENWPRSLYRPRLLATGAALGGLTILLGFPTGLVGEFGLVAERLFGGPVGRATHATGPDAPTWWWFLRQYLTGLGWPLFVGGVGGVLTTVALTARRRVSGGMVLVLTALAAFVALFVPWHDFRVHHLLPTFPLVAILTASSLLALRDRRETVGRVAIGLLLVSSAVYAGVGVLGYADMPRDQAVDWLEENADEGETIEVYRRHFQDTALPHGASVNHLFGSEEAYERADPCPTYVQLGYRDLLYLSEGSYYRSDQDRAEYVRALFDGEYGYELVAEFGPRPRNFVPERPTPGSLTDLLSLGVIPQTGHYADEQELQPNQYTAILKLTGECDQDRDPPF
ncbi:glycosyltransferase family 39 protein [Halorhabdus amylolytica]|uniref:glycosyltransferase family 39 protein n=1 Tax=Halorhabdus amylolytica TaxID=2559573 RepID=UPI0010AAD005|nr:glycosyltransferase family 39 protein [Halorhabdus amylolytica]